MILHVSLISHNPAYPSAAPSRLPLLRLPYLYFVLDRVAVVMVKRREGPRACFFCLFEIVHEFRCLKYWVIAVCLMGLGFVKSLK